MVCVKFTTENGTHVERGLNTNFHLTIFACWLLHFNTFGKLKKIAVKIKRECFSGELLNVLQMNANASQHNKIYIIILKRSL